MRIAYFTESLPPNTDGVVKTLCHLTDSLLEKQIDFHFFSPIKPDESYSWHDKVTKVSSVPFALYSYYKMGLPYFDGIDKKCAKYTPDLIHIASPTPLGVYGLRYAQKNDIPVVTSYHTHFVDYFRYFGLEKLEKIGWNYLQWFHNQCMRTYAPSPSSVNELENRDINNVELWQRGIEFDRFSPKFRSSELRDSVLDHQKPILLFVGRLINHKDLDDLAAANLVLKQRGRDFKLVIIGDGPMRPELEKSLPDAHFTGFVHGPKLASWYASSDIFAFPSTTETFGNVILEAFASGIPAVGVNAGGVADIITHGKDGLLANPKDPVDFADQLDRLLTRPQLAQQLIQQAEKTAKTYSWKAINNRLVESYRQVISEHQSFRLNAA
ncbi:MAG: glycosyltransferase family 1 protein [candidate division KSB1 bacterium]|nr:glycosyltransferase family 1 protein [candidate division KSB1 bacterium]